MPEATTKAKAEANQREASLPGGMFEVFEVVELAPRVFDIGISKRQRISRSAFG